MAMRSHEVSFRSMGEARAGSHRSSWWFLLALPFGLTTWVMFIILAVRDRSPRYAISAFFYFCLAAAPFILFTSHIHDSGPIEGIALFCAVLALPIAWVSGIVLGIFIDRRTNGATFELVDTADTMPERQMAPRVHHLLPPEQWLAKLVEERQRTHRTRPILRLEQNYGREGLRLLSAAYLWGIGVIVCSIIGFGIIVGTQDRGGLVEVLVIAAAFLFLVPAIIRSRQGYWEGRRFRGDRQFVFRNPAAERIRQSFGPSGRAPRK